MTGPSEDLTKTRCHPQLAPQAKLSVNHTSCISTHTRPARKHASMKRKNASIFFLPLFLTLGSAGPQLPSMDLFSWAEGKPGPAHRDGGCSGGATPSHTPTLLGSGLRGRSKCQSVGERVYLGGPQYFYTFPPVPLCPTLAHTHSVFQRRAEKLNTKHLCCI